MFDQSQDLLSHTAHRHPALASTDEIIAEARAGRMFILVDDEDRENEGDLVISAQMASPQAINFMARHGRGLICLALTQGRADLLGLERMPQRNSGRHQTAFTVSIEAREGVTTGISAADRSHTILTAIDPARTAGDIASPGHVFPLIAREGGVLTRPGHTEAAVDVARLAGLTPAGVICEIMRDDGRMARLDDLIGFAATHDMKIGTIRDLIEWRQHHDRGMDRLAQQDFTSKSGGDWIAHRLHDPLDGQEALILQKGRVMPGKAALTCIYGMGAQPKQPMSGATLSRIMQLIEEEGAGFVVLPGGLTPCQHNLAADRQLMGRIFASMDISEIVLLTRDAAEAQDYGIRIAGTRPIY
ncbi:MAG: 3,4-dihydroxy-2-butanone-4-phosphate synthase [Paracoccus sp. (in: a-proteobacteria)]|nr:3,4-dihydroxy-2-butanone-4-phosphate synthase [Paracoccus sp. (in: a-proteobacteria)]